MTKFLSNDTQQELIKNLTELIAFRAGREESLNETFQTAMESAEAEYQQAEETAAEQFERARDANETEFKRTCDAVTPQCTEESRTTQREYDRVLQEIEGRYAPQLETVTEKHQDARWMASSVYDDSAADSPRQQYDAFKTQSLKQQESLSHECDALETMLQQSREMMVSRRLGYGEPPTAPIKLPTDVNALQERFTNSLAEARQAYECLQRQLLSRLFAGWRPLGLFVLFWVLALPAALSIQVNLLEAWENPAGIDRAWGGISAGIAVGVSLVLCLVLHGIARSRAGDHYQDLLDVASETSAVFRKWMKLTNADLKSRKAAYKQQHLEMVSRRDAVLTKYDSALNQELSKIQQAKDAELARVNHDYPERLQQLTANRDQRMKEAELRFASQQNDLTRNYEALRDNYPQIREQQISAIQQKSDQEWSELKEEWLARYGQIQESACAMGQACRGQISGFDQLKNSVLQISDDLPDAIPFGEYAIDLSAIENGIPDDARLKLDTTEVSFPALLPFPEQPSLLLECHQEGRRRAVDAMRVVMLRMLMSLPPGKVRFTVIDPVGLGENFSSFMHLADYDELLINSRIWTNASDIENRLKTLTDHMETIFQTYLRNEFSTLEEYNQHAGEVAEPYHILVVANLPHNFTDESWRRMVSIATSGSRCGVYTLISVDTQQALPAHFDLDELRQNATHLVWENGRFQSQVPELSALALDVDAPPDDETFVKIVREAGEQSKDIRRVEVAFSRVAPSEKQLWTQDSRGGIDIPLGRAGATKLQHLRLGKGTSQHVLVAGRTGSGKSSFLHVLITNAALHYSPNEVEFYLIDFKKGVEFKSYALHGLPHARVIAIESEREFGLSVLKRLDAILKERGDLFRQHAVQDIAGYRNANPEEVMPRIMLVVDEFQEFFVDDDALSQDASLLLDRLVRQGRAFGIHVLLGSQTLAGAYSIARSTLGQIGVRIALQCSEADAHLILSENNSAARLLVRPGEAIYNDANGLVEGNHPFQIAWLPDDRRDACLERIQGLVRERDFAPELPVIFEGNVPADARRSPHLSAFLGSTSSQQMWSANQSSIEPEIYLGEAVEIKESSSITFRRQSGGNLVIVGQNPHAALGMFTTSILDLATQIVPRDPESESPADQFYLFDGGMSDQPEGDLWKDVVDTIPHGVSLVSQRSVGESIDAIRAEVDRRSERDEGSAPPMFLFLFNLGRLRDFRKGDDDFGFGSMGSDEAVSPAQQLSHILREGPAVGVHTLIWCDTYNNLNRWFSSQTMRELETRVAFPMSAGDSSNLIDSPVASKLGVNRALLYQEALGTLEKFRPYGLPTDELLAELQGQFGKDQAVQPG